MNRPTTLLTYLCGLLLLATTISVQAGWWDTLNQILGGGSENDKSVLESATAVLSNEEIAAAFKQALELGSGQVIQQVSAVDGFNGDRAIHIPLPEQLQTARSWLSNVGMESSLDKLEVSLNRAAEAAAPEAKQLFINAITQMTFDDIRQIYQGPDDAATQYFQRKMTPTLSAAISPIVDQSLSKVGALNRYDTMIAAYKSIPFVPDIKADLRSHVVDGTLDGIFHYLAQQEAAIRKDPVKQTTALLQKVFGR